MIKHLATSFDMQWLLQLHFGVHHRPALVIKGFAYVFLRLQSTESLSPSFTDSQYSNDIPSHFLLDFNCLAHMIHFHKFQRFISALVSGLANGFVWSRAPFRQSLKILIIPFLHWAD